jgi:predicted MarR family transcription regulator
LSAARHQETVLKKTRTTTSKKTPGIARPAAAPIAPEQPGSWHLARTETERRLSDIEFGLERLAQAY